jgi:hypothetical protein
MPNRTDPEAHKDQVKRANAARKEAVDALIKMHPIQFDRLYAEAAAKRGVSPTGRRR